MSNVKKTFIFLILCAFLSSCGYRLGTGGNCPTMTFSMPFIEGDKDGIFTAAIIKEVSARTSLTYCPSSAESTLIVKIIDLRDENVGFRYDRKRDGDLRKNIIPVETRLEVRVEVTLYRSYDNALLLGPELIGAFIDFDHEYYPNRDQVNVFSLGQLTDIDAARDAAIFPLSRELANRVADYFILCGDLIGESVITN